MARFEKVHRVPFGEYIPDRAFFSHLANLSAVPLDAIPGHGDGLLKTPTAPIGTMVSYEVFYAARGRIATRAGAQVLIVPTNTSSYSNSQVPTQEIAASRLQAIAEGRDLVQASPTGFSAIVDHDGVVESRSSLGTRQVLFGDVRLRTGATVYERLGDLPVLIAAGLLLVGGWLASLTGAGASETAQRRTPPAAPSRPGADDSPPEPLTASVTSRRMSLRDRSRSGSGRPSRWCCTRRRPDRRSGLVQETPLSWLPVPWPRLGSMLQLVPFHVSTSGAVDDVVA